MENWNLEDIYKNLDDYNKDIDKVCLLVNDIVSFKGSILKSDKSLLDLLLKEEEIDRIISKLYVYINMKLHIDTRNSMYQELTNKLDMVLSTLNEKMSFIVPELLESDYDLVLSYIDKNNNLKRFSFLLSNIYSKKDHILSKDIEELLSRCSNVFNASDNIFTNLNEADLKFDKIKDENNKLCELTHGTYYTYLTSNNRNVRKNAFNSLYKKYKEYNNTYSSIFINNLNTTSFICKTRNYKSPLNMHLDGNKIDENIYYDLIKAVNDNLDKMGKYIKLKKEKLNLKELHMYDINAKMNNGVSKNYTYSEAKDLVLKALNVLGKDYINDLNNLFNGGVVDVYETPGKRSGAYSWGSYDTHPYVLLNFQGKYNDVSTIAHEMGHAMNKYYSDKNQDFYYSGNEIFTAEIASTVNETLLNLYMLNNSDDDTKKDIINEMLDDIKNTLYRQTMFAEFELIVHNKVFNNEALSSDILNNIYYDLVKKYHEGAIIDDGIKYEWSRIPHFYTPFYVYQYATGISIAYTIAFKIYDNDKDMLDKYLKFLGEGSSDYPVNLVSKMDIDIKDSVNYTLNKFNELIDEYRK